jgi:hypothetical protein
LSIFGFVIREKKKFFYEVPRLLDHPLVFLYCLPTLKKSLIFI